MTARGCLVRVNARYNRGSEAQELLRVALSETQARASFVVRFAPTRYGVVECFADEHVTSRPGAAGDDELFAEPPAYEGFEILAHKLGSPEATNAVSKGVLLTFKPKPGNEQATEDFLRGARSIVEEEPGTTAWFAIRFDDGRLGIFDVFPGNRGRVAHLTGRVPRELAKRSTDLLGGLPRMQMATVIHAASAHAQAQSGAALSGVASG